MRLPHVPSSHFHTRFTSIVWSLALAVTIILACAGCGGGGGAVSVTPDIPAPPVFPDLKKTGINPAVPGNKQVTLIWNVSPGATAYNVYRDDFTDPKHLLKGGVVQTTFTDTSVTNGKTYTYEATATNVSGESAKSEPKVVPVPVTFTFSISPPQSSLNNGQTQTFTAPVAGDGTDPKQVSFSIQDATGKVISDGSAGQLGPTSLVSGIPTVVYTAPSLNAPQTYFIVAVYGANPSLPNQTQKAAVIVGAGSGSVTIPIQ